MPFLVRDRVQIFNLKNKFVGYGTIINFNDFREPGMEYAVVVDGYEGEFFVGEDQIKKLEGDVK